MQILIKSGKNDKWISKYLGMSIDEVFRLKQLSGLAELFKDKKFSNAWEVENENI
ncbi:ParB-like nuclease [Candidatus Hepatincola sp. Pdp]